MADLRYPVGRHERRQELGDDARRECIDAIAAAPAAMRAAVRGLSDEQLDMPYRPEGWTVRQVVHHVPDSHVNAYIRFKLALTEEQPAIRPYEEARWAELKEARTAPPEISLAMLETLHTRWVMSLRSMQPSDFARTLMHPVNGVMTLDAMLGLYAWHGRHHVGHITALRERMGW